MIEHLIVAIIFAIYLTQFYVDQYVFLLPARSKLNGMDLPSSYNKQKRFSFITRFCIAIVYPLSAFLVDRGYFIEETVVWFVFGLLLLPIFALACFVKNSFQTIIYSFGDHRVIRFGSFLYGFHFLGVPVAIYAATHIPEYRATIMQLGVVLNTISALAQVWLVDAKISHAMTNKTNEELSFILNLTAAYRLIGKLTSLFFLGLLYA